MPNMAFAVHRRFSLRSNFPRLGVRYFIIGLSVLFCSTKILADDNVSSENDKIFRMSVFAKLRIDPPGASNAVVAYIMAQAGYRTEFIYIPPKRMEYSLLHGSIDAMQKSGLAHQYRAPKEGYNFVQAYYPTVAFEAMIYYKRSPDWQPSWPPLLDFQTKAKGATINYMFLNAAGLQLTQVKSTKAGGSMVNEGRVDYWIEVMNFPEGSLDVRLNEEQGFVSDKIFDIPLFLMFNDNEQGRQFKQAWDSGFKALMSDPDKFAEVYLAGLPKEYFTVPLQNFTTYVQATYPEFRQPILSK